MVASEPDRGGLERFLDCGVLCRGAALLVCEDCPEVIALSRGLKRMRPADCLCHLDPEKERNFPRVVTMERV